MKSLAFFIRAGRFSSGKQTRDYKNRDRIAFPAADKFRLQPSPVIKRVCSSCSLEQRPDARDNAI